MKVLIVDDSVVFRRKISEVLEELPEFQVVSSASNGKIALKKLDHYDIDLMIIDLEMPVLDGESTIKEIKKLDIRPKIVVFTSNSMSGASHALNALELGADDFALKPAGSSGSMEEVRDQVASELVPKLMQFIKKRAPADPSPTIAKGKAPRYRYNADTSEHKVKKDESSWVKVKLDIFKPKAIVIACSTGGPAALEELFDGLPKFSFPIFIAQHMPPMFTSQLANRLDRVTENNVVEASDGDLVEPGMVYLAPGGYHMNVVSESEKCKISLNQEARRNFVIPAADYTFESSSQIYKNYLMGFVLTGMGSDGCDGAIAIKNGGGGIVIQDEDSSTVWGMPGAVYEENAYDAVKSLSNCRELILSYSHYGEKK
ncbi:MAG: chemotaxis-specific protein-glutamate methyltransferase CheB [Oligoflexales bacterium]